MAYEIIVYCEGRTLRDTLQPSHPKRRASIARLTFYADGEDTSAWAGMQMINRGDRWIPNPVSSRRYAQLRNAGVDDAQEALVVQEIGEDGAPIDLDAAGPRPEFHHKVLMHCPLCHLDLQFRLETITPHLDILRHAGWDSVSLSALAAIVRK